MSIRSLNIAPRAGLGFGVLAVMVFALGGFALLQMANMRQQSDQVENNRGLMNIRALAHQTSTGGEPDQRGDSGVVTVGGGLDSMVARFSV